MVAISALLRLCYDFASPKNKAKAAKENALDRPQIAQTKSNQEADFPALTGANRKRPAGRSCLH